ncbi:hypothetical protein LY78DRAFT_313465 [Colletotrichum sublineola]|nr:hypothetical protein LY78DRAFT_313465 [Colletotrichum sublineola]
MDPLVGRIGIHPTGWPVQMGRVVCLENTQVRLSAYIYFFCFLRHMFVAVIDILVASTVIAFVHELVCASTPSDNK